MKKLLFILLLIPLFLPEAFPASNLESGYVFAYAQSNTTNYTSDEPYSTIRIPLYRDMREHIYFAFDPSTGDIYLLNWRSKQLTRYTEQGDSEVIALTGDEIPQNLIVDVRRNRASDEPELYLWDSGIGRVFTVDTRTGTITRVDKSFEHRNMYYHAAYVSEQNEIHAMGGYGFWRYKNFLITYNPKSNEWLEESQTNNEIVYEGGEGSLFHTETALFYYVKDAYSSEQGMFRMDLQSRKWERYSLFDELLYRKSASGFEGFSRLRQTTTYQINEEKGAMLFYFKESRLPKIIKVNSKENSLYEVDLLLFNVDEVFALFYSKRMDKWVMVYESAANSKQDNLYVTTLSVDAEESYVKPLAPVASSSWTAWHYTLLSLGIVLFFTIGGVYWVRKRGGNHTVRDIKSTESSLSSEGTSPDTVSDTIVSSGSVAEDEGTMLDDGISSPLILEPNGTNITAKVGNRQIILPGIKQNQGKDIFQIVYDMVLENTQEISVVNFDEDMFPDDQVSLASYKRKRLFEALHQELGFELFQERRGAIDARFKILLLNRKRVRIIDKSP